MAGCRTLTHRGRYHSTHKHLPAVRLTLSLSLPHTHLPPTPVGASHLLPGPSPLANGHQVMRWRSFGARCCPRSFSCATRCSTRTSNSRTGTTPRHLRFSALLPPSLTSFVFSSGAVASVELADLLADEYHKFYRAFTQEQLQQFLGLVRKSALQVIDEQQDALAY